MSALVVIEAVFAVGFAIVALRERRLREMAECERHLWCEMARAPKEKAK